MLSSTSNSQMTTPSHANTQTSEVFSLDTLSIEFDGKQLLVDTGNIFSKLTLSWVPTLQKLILGDHKSLKLPEGMDITQNEIIFKKYFLDKDKAGLGHAINKFAKERIHQLLPLILIYKALDCCSLLILYYFFVAVLDPEVVDIPSKMACFLLALLTASFLLGLVKNYAQFQVEKTGLVIESSLTSLIQTKLFRKSLESDSKFEKEDLLEMIRKVRIMAVERPKMYYYITECVLHFIMILVFGFIFFDFKPFAMSFGFLLLMTAVLTSCSILIKNTRLAVYQVKNRQRVDYVLSILNNIFYAKARGWDQTLKKIVKGMRKEEVSGLSGLNNIESVWIYVVWILTFLSALCFFLIHINDHIALIGVTFDLYTRILLTSLRLVNSLDLYKIKDIDFKQLLTSIQEHLDSDEVAAGRNKILYDRTEPKTNALTLKVCSFYWDVEDPELHRKKKSIRDTEQALVTRQIEKANRKDRYRKRLQEMEDLDAMMAENSERYTLNTVASGESEIFAEAEDTFLEYQLINLNLEVKKGDACFILGTASSGKSSLLKALIGEMKLDVKPKPTLVYNGSLHYMGESPWILDGTLKENVIMNQVFDKERFMRALKLSLLDQIFGRGGLGVNVNMNLGSDFVTFDPLFNLKVECARAVYSRAQIVLIDDSFLQYSGRSSYKLFYSLVKLGLKNKTVIYTSRKRRFANFFGQFVVLEKGRIIYETHQLAEFDEFVGEASHQEDELFRNFENRSFMSRSSEVSKTSHMDMFSRVRDNNIKAKEKKNSILEDWRRNSRNQSSSGKKPNRFSTKGGDNYPETTEFQEESVQQMPAPSIKKLFMNTAFRTILAVVCVVYAISSGSEVSLFLFMNNLTFKYRSMDYVDSGAWGALKSTIHDAKADVIKMGVIIGVGYVFLPISLYLMRSKICHRVSNYFHDIVISTILNVDIYKMARNTARSIYLSNVIPTLNKVDKEIHKEMNVFLYTASFSLTLGLCLAYFLTPFIILPFFLGSLAAFLLWLRHKASAEDIKKVDSFLKIKYNSVLEDIIAGKQSIHAAQSQVYFEVKLNFFLERKLLTNMCTYGSHFWLRLRVYVFAVLVLVAPAYLVAWATYERGAWFWREAKVGDELWMYRNLLLMMVVLVGILPDYLAETMKSVDRVYSNLCEMDNALVLTNYGSEEDDKHFVIAGSRMRNQTRRMTLQRIRRLQADRELNLADTIPSETLLMLENVNIYDDFNAENALIKNINLQFKANEKVAILGDTMTPLSALIDLILQFNLDYSGEVNIRNQNIKLLDIHKVRNQVLFLDKYVPIISGTLQDNISPNLRGLKARQKNSEKIEKLLNLFGFDKQKATKMLREQEKLDFGLGGPHVLSTENQGSGKKGKLSNPKRIQARVLGIGAIRTGALMAPTDLDSDRTETLLDTQDGGSCTIEELLKLNINEKSLSARDRTAIGMTRVFYDNRKINLLDRLDARFQSVQDLLSFNEMVKECLGDKLVLMVCEKATTAEYFDRVVVFKEGTVVEDGKPDELKERVGEDGKVVGHFAKLLKKELEIYG